MVAENIDIAIRVGNSALGIRLAIAFPTRADMVPRVRAFADLLQASFAETA